MAFVCRIGLYQLHIRPKLPYSIQEVKEGIVLTDPLGTIEIKQIASPLVLTIDSVSVSKEFEVDIIVENKRIGDSVTIVLSNSTSLQPKLIRRNDIWTVLINGFSGVFCLIIAIILMIYGNHWEERYFSLFTYFFGLSLVITWPGMKLPFILALLMSLVYFFSFALAPVFFLFFSLHFPSSTLPEKSLKAIKYVTGILGLTFCFVLTVLNLLKIYRLSTNSMQSYNLMKMFFWGFIFL